jgi:putative membrane protein
MQLKHLPYIGLALGIAILVLLLIWQGLVPVIEILLDTGWKLLWLPLVWLPGLLMTGLAWRLLFPPLKRPGYGHTFLATWIGRSINTLLPVASVGGEVIKARLVMLWGSSGVNAAASVVVDKTLQALTLILWGLFGVSLLALLTVENELAVIALAGFLLLGVGVGAFILVQQTGMLSVLARLAERLFEHDFITALKTNALQVDAAIRRTYRARRDLAKATVWHIAALVYQTAEVWLACYLLGHPITIVEALLLKSLTTTIADIAFIIPSGYGIQEGAYLVLGVMLGMSPETALALALAIRIRDVVIEVPGLLYWHGVESRELLKRRSSNA